MPMGFNDNERDGVMESGGGTWASVSTEYRNKEEGHQLFCKSVGVSMRLGG